MRRLLLTGGMLLAAVAGPCDAGGPVFSVVAAWSGAAPTAGGDVELRVEVTIQPGWHVNSDAPRDPYLIPTSVRLDLPKGWSNGKPTFPAARLAKFAFSDETLAVFEGRFAITIPVRVSAEAAASTSVHGVLEAQACNDSTCLAPAEVAFTVALAADGPAARAATAPAVDVASVPIHTAGGVPAGFAGSGLLLQLAVVFLAGLALNLTPCVYPLIPITIGYFAAQRQAARARTWLLAITYVLGMSVTYSALGVAAALSGSLFGAAMQSVWVVGLLVVVLLALATSMFGLWELRVPAWATRVSGGRSGAGGALVMGLVVGLVAAPCIGPFVLGLLTYVGQRGDVVLGFGLFFTLALGLGLPYLFLGVFTGAIERLPNSGAWMLGVRQLFGVLLVALAGYFAKPFIPPPWGDRLFAGLLLIGGVYLLVIARPGHEQPWIDRFMRLASAAVLVAGVVLLPSRASTEAELTWQPYDEGAVGQAMAGGRPVVLDFYATWCLPCKELDEKTFPDPRVSARLATYARFKVDLTRDDPANDALRKKFDVAGVPTVAFFRASQEVAGTRLTGFEPASEFLKRLDRVAGQ